MAITKRFTDTSEERRFFEGKVLFVSHSNDYVIVGSDGWPLTEATAQVYDGRPQQTSYAAWGKQRIYKLVPILTCAVWTGHRDEVPFTQQFVLLEIPVKTSLTTEWTAEPDASLDDVNVDPMMFVNFVAWSSAVKHAREQYKSRQGLDLVVNAAMTIRHMTVEEYVDKWG